jgi:hypothetical protein
MRATKVCIALDMAGDGYAASVPLPDFQRSIGAYDPINNNHDDLRGRGSHTSLSLV